MTTTQSDDHNWNIKSAHCIIFLHGTEHLTIFPKCQFLYEANIFDKKSSSFSPLSHQFNVISFDYIIKDMIILFVLFVSLILPGSSSDSKSTEAEAVLKCLMHTGCLITTCRT